MGIGPNHQSTIPNPQSPIPKCSLINFRLNYHFIIYYVYKKNKFNIN
ncbi:MAG: hypothetical protein MJ252_21315 [archaeon]|nr:hypothetical protein [archaeon]